MTIIDVGMYKGICKCDNSKFRDETSNMAKFKELKETSFYDRWNMFIYGHVRLKNYTEVFADSLGEIVFKLRLMLTGTLIFF